ncbi:MAG: ABC transporter ATP-binding protein [Chloroflexi bacterium]|mgnify:CR=1 FL=1|jgi:heme ABC exporter ATP-binding subunit CcmA|nr:ABC transporter ATP-binding protein [Chloroflexota bacterium]MBT7080627.1 ABC transporter ATP-binding protein [Chloroflexota bacterium]
MENKEDKSTSNSDFTIEAEGVTKSFGHHLVLRGIDLKLKRGEFLTIFGRNGAGKTTFLKILATLLRPSFGSVYMAGLDLSKNSMDIRRKIGVVSHQTFLYDELTAYENIKFYGKMYDVPKLDERARELIAKVGLASCIHEKVNTFSRGMQQRLTIARAMVHNPSILLLDEPETGLDQYASAMLQDLLTTFEAEKRTVVMTSHSLERGLQMGNRVVILSEGKIACDVASKDMSVSGLQELYQRYTGEEQ